MGYVLGIGLGHTRTRAALVRTGPRSCGQAVAAPLHDYTTTGQPEQQQDGSIETVLHIAADGSVLVGQAAEAMTETDPARVTRGFVGRVGDVVPIVLPEGPYSAEVLTASVVGWVADEVAAIEGAAPERVAVAHPTDWGAHRRGALHMALQDVGLPGALLVPDAVAAAHAQRQHLAADAVLGFGRLGGARFNDALVRATRSGFELLAPAGCAALAPGWRIDDLLLRHVLDRAGYQKQPPPGRTLAGLAAECDRAKRHLSDEREVSLPVPAPDSADRIEIGRAEFERLAKPVLRTALTSLRHKVASTVPAGSAVVMLAGGTARIPLARELGERMFADELALADDPAATVCRGAALAVRGSTELAGVESHVEPEGTATTYDDDPIGSRPQRPPVEVASLEPPKRRVGLRLGQRRSAAGDS